MAFPSFEAGDTIQFTWTASVSPDSAPTFGVTNPADVVVQSAAAVSSDSSAYYALHQTVTSSTGLYVGEWVAAKTVAGSVYTFRTRFVFRVERTQAPD